MTACLHLASLALVKMTACLHLASLVSVTKKEVAACSHLALHVTVHALFYLVSPIVKPQMKRCVAGSAALPNINSV